MPERRQPRGGKRGMPKKDLALVFGPSADGEGFNVLRRRAESTDIEAGTLKPLKDGHAIVGEVVRLSPREEGPFVFDCETDEELSTVRSSQMLAGPAQVASEDYRRGWDAIWGTRARPSAAN